MPKVGVKLSGLVVAGSDQVKHQGLQAHQGWDLGSYSAAKWQRREELPLAQSQQHHGEYEQPPPKGQ